MQAMQLNKTAPIDQKPLQLVELPDPEPGEGQIRIAVKACALCHTDLHIVEGELPPHLRPVVPGHQIVGKVDKCGPGVSHFKEGDRVGVPWLYHTDGTCRYCRSGRENLCEHGQFTGYDANGGYASYNIVDQDFAYALPDNFDDLQAAPLLCAGVIGYRAMKQAEVKPGSRVGLYGFGASAHICIQIARHWDCEVYVFTRGEEHRQLSRQLGAKWSGSAGDPIPTALDHSIIFAPAGGLVIEALKTLDKGGTLALAGIYMTPIPSFDYSLIYGERTVRSVANSTRQDAIELLKLAAEIPVKTEIQLFELAELNEALLKLKTGQINGSGVVKIA
ncbi:MAG TPA: zinc-dependent alcohol dehydrogenase family protein [Chloroflexia bacterium]|nr:zinc-dependent alcohol dehydrogenase family protein [Chloroflexia bacterium]